MTTFLMLAMAHWDMSGYGFYVWTCVIAVLGGVLIMGYLSLRGLKNAKAQEAAVEAASARSTPPVVDAEGAARMASDAPADEASAQEGSGEAN